MSLKTIKKSRTTMGEKRCATMLCPARATMEEEADADAGIGRTTGVGELRWRMDVRTDAALEQLSATGPRRGASKRRCYVSVQIANDRRWRRSWSGPSQSVS